jgi:glycosyltransferase EpsF
MSRTPVRVLHVFGGMNRGGAETFIMNVLRGLDPAAAVFDFAVNTAAPCAYDEEIRACGGRLFAHPAPGVVGIRAWCHAFGRTLQLHGPFDVVHSHVHYFSGYVLREAARHLIPIRVAHSHNDHDGRAGTPFRLTYRAYARALLLAWGTHLIGCSERANRSLFGRRACRQTRMVRYGIVPEHFDDRMTAGEARAALGLPPTAFVLGHVGRFDVQKNHRGVLEIFRALRGLRPDARLVLAGTGPLMSEVRLLAAQWGLVDHVRFLGPRSDIPVVLRSLDALIMPSIHEGFPVALVEAQASGVPSLISEAITAEIELGTAPMGRLPLTAAPATWATALLDMFARPRLPWHERSRRIQAAGCDAVSSRRHLLAMYGSPA